MFRYSLVFLVGLSTVGSAAAASWADGMFDELARDFGSVPRGPLLTHQFHLVNNTSGPIHIAGVRVSCGCVSAFAQQQDLPPGKETLVMAQMDTHRFSGPKTVTIYVTLDQPSWEEVRLSVHANSRDDITISPESLAFGQVKKGSGSRATATISFLGDSQWQIQDVESESNYIQTSLKEQKRDSGEMTYVVTAEIRKDCPVGKWFTDVWVKTNNPSSPKIRIPLTVDVESPLTITSSNVTLGKVKVGESTEKKVIIRGAKPFRIIAIEGTDGQWKVESNTKDAKPVHILTVTLKSQKTGNLKRNLRIMTDLPEEGELDFQAMAQVVR